MKLIKEYKINNFGRNVIYLPEGTQIISAYNNDNSAIRVSLIASCPEDTSPQERVFYVWRTGEYMIDDARYITSVHIPGLFLHIFEGMEE